MGVWGGGVFDNDTAADFAGRFDDTPADGRVALLVSALEDALGSCEDDLEEFGGYALAAGAIIAARLPGAPELDSPYAPTSMAELSLTAGPALAALALRAFDHVVSHEPEWAEIYAEADGAGAGLVELQRRLAAAD